MHHSVFKVLEGKNYVLYKLPHNQQIYIIVAEEEHKLFNINHIKPGFIFAPFHISTNQPIYIYTGKPQPINFKDFENFIALTHNTPHLDIPNSINTEYQIAFNKFIAGLQTKQFQKLVLSRFKTIAPPPNFNKIISFIKACTQYPNAFVYLYENKAIGTWLGASPEVLLSSSDNKTWTTYSLAGTMTTKDATKWSDKNKLEQNLVSYYIKNTIQQFGTITAELGPTTFTAGNLIHLKTEFKFTLNNIKDLGHFIDNLSPTPAVCGLPKQEAQKFIVQNENIDRKYYSGFIGLYGTEQTQLYVNLRCCNIINNKINIYAGGGILPCSNMEEEWQETENKMQTIETCLI